MTTIRSEAIKTMRKLFKELGFHNNKYFFARKMENGAINLISEGLRIQEGKALINCNIGITFESIAKIEKKIVFGNLAPFYLAPIIQNRLAYLTPEIKSHHYEWQIAELINGEVQVNEHVLDDIKGYISSAGYAFYDKYGGSIDSVLYELENMFKNDIERMNPNMSIPIIYYLRGEKQKGLEYIERVIEDMATPRIAPDQKIIKEGNTEFYIMREEFSEKKLLELLKKYGAVQLGTGCDGIVDSNYLKFAEGYNALADDVQGLLASVKLKI